MIFYTLDGSKPDKNSIRYKKPVTVSAKTTLRAVAMKKGYVTSDEAVSKYLPVDIRGGVHFSLYEGRWEYLPDFTAMKPVKAGTVRSINIEEVTDRKMYFGIVFHGIVDVKKPGEYTFYISSNDGGILSVDNRIVADNDGAHGTQERSGKVYLKKGRHLIEVRYFQAGGGKSLKVSWEGPSFGKREMFR